MHKTAGWPKQHYITAYLFVHRSGGGTFLRHSLFSAKDRDGQGLGVKCSIGPIVALANKLPLWCPLAMEVAAPRQDGL